MNMEYWLDGFNFFHHWEKSKSFFSPGGGMDIGKTIDQCLRILSRELGGKRRAALVFLDGGLQRGETRHAGLRIRYAGPGQKADDRMVDDLDLLGNDARCVIAVSNDRELKGRLRMHGASCLSVGEFLALLEKKDKGQAGKGGSKGKRGADDAEIMREKCRSLSPAEVSAWLEHFGGEAE